MASFCKDVNNVEVEAIKKPLPHNIVADRGYQPKGGLLLSEPHHSEVIVFNKL